MDDASTPPLVEIQVSFPDAGSASAFAEAVVAERVVACAQQWPIRSRYRWDGEVCDDDEVLVVSKTTSERYDDVCSVVDRLHPDDVPMVLEVPVGRVTPAYAAWVADQVIAR